MDQPFRHGVGRHFLSVGRHNLTNHSGYLRPRASLPPTPPPMVMVMMKMKMIIATDKGESIGRSVASAAVVGYTVTILHCCWDTCQLLSAGGFVVMGRGVFDTALLPSWPSASRENSRRRGHACVRRRRRHKTNPRAACRPPPRDIPIRASLIACELPVKRRPRRNVGRTLDPLSSGGGANRMTRSASRPSPGETIRKKWTGGISSEGRTCGPLPRPSNNYATTKSSSDGCKAKLSSSTFRTVRRDGIVRGRM
jgi:hypothetical protein